MSEEIGLQRHVAFADPRLERSTAVKCTEADHYISTTARSDICVLPACLSLFKSPSWTALDIRVLNQDTVPFTKPMLLFPEPNGFKCFLPYLFWQISPLFLKCIFLPHASLFRSPFLLLQLLNVFEWLRVMLRLVCRQNVFRSIRQPSCCFLFTEVHGKEHKEEVESAATLQ